MTMFLRAPLMHDARTNFAVSIQTGMAERSDTLRLDASAQYAVDDRAQDQVRRNRSQELVRRQVAQDASQE